MPTCPVTPQPQGMRSVVGLGTCQPRAAQGMEQGAEPAFAFANEADSPVPIGLTPAGLAPRA